LYTGSPLSNTCIAKVYEDFIFFKSRNSQTCSAPI
jgi:hypothetical protein